LQKATHQFELLPNYSLLQGDLANLVAALKQIIHGRTLNSVPENISFFSNASTKIKEFNDDVKIVSNKTMYLYIRPLWLSLRTERSEK
jgi:hypothetical protein